MLTSVLFLNWTFTLIMTVIAVFVFFVGANLSLSKEPIYKISATIMLLTSIVCFGVVALIITELL